MNPEIEIRLKSALDSCHPDDDAAIEIKRVLEMIHSEQNGDGPKMNKPLGRPRSASIFVESDEDDRQVCSCCGERKMEHCGFFPIVVPARCKCDDPTNWVDTSNITEVCDKFIGDKEEFCNTCEHEYACHKKLENE